MNKQTCPLCNNEAFYTIIDGSNEKLFTCRICTKYIITNAAEQRVIAQTANWQEALSQEAQGATQSGFVVRIYSQEATKPGEPIAYERLPLDTI